MLVAGSVLLVWQPSNIARARSRLPVGATPCDSMWLEAPYHAAFMYREDATNAIRYETHKSTNHMLSDSSSAAASSTEKSCLRRASIILSDVIFGRRSA